MQSDKYHLKVVLKYTWELPCSGMVRPADTEIAVMKKDFAYIPRKKDTVHHTGRAHRVVLGSTRT
jgi:hypothetical protein